MFATLTLAALIGTAPAPQSASDLGVPADARWEEHTAGDEDSGQLAPRASLSAGQFGAGDAGEWVFVPPPRFGRAAAAYDAHRDRVLLFAPGAGMWHFERASSTWFPVEAAGITPPSVILSQCFDSLENQLLFVGVHPDRSIAGIYALRLEDVPVWVQLHPARGDLPPAGRQGQTVIFDSNARRFFLFGGRDRDGSHSDLWEASLDTGIWREVTPVGTPPIGRSDAGGAYDRVHDRLIVLGGLVETTPRFLEAAHDLWTLELSGPPVWRQVHPEGAPARLSGPKLVADPTDDRLYYFPPGDTSGVVYRLTQEVDPDWESLPGTGEVVPLGRPVIVFAESSDGFILADGGQTMDTIDLSTFGPRSAPQWNQIRGQPIPGPRFGHAMVHDVRRDRAIIFGGVTSDGLSSRYLAEPWWMDLSGPPAWEPIHAIGESPPPRHEPVAIYDPQGQRMLVFGGWTYPSSYFDDTWELSLEGVPEWRPLSTAAAPPGRRAHAGIYDPVRHRFLIYGGSDDIGTLGDVWELDLTSPVPQWRELPTSGPGPGARYFASAVYDPVRDRMIVSGGTRAGRSLDDVYALDLARHEWLQLEGIRTVQPSRHSAIFDLARDRVVYYGGWYMDYDLIISFSALQAVSFQPLLASSHLRPKGSPFIFPAAHAAIYDPRRDRMVSFGGAQTFYGTNGTAILEFSGRAPEIHAWLLSSRVDADRAELTWFVPSSAGLPIHLERRELGGGWVVAGTIPGDGSDRIAFLDTGLKPGWRYAYRVRAPDGSVSHEVTIGTPGRPRLTMLGSWPNPTTSSRPRLWMSLAAGEKVVVETFDVQGRLLTHTSFVPRHSGVQSVAIDHDLAPGVHLARVTQGSEESSRRIVVLP